MIRRTKGALLMVILASCLSTHVIAATSWADSAILELLVQDDGAPSTNGLVVVTMPTNMTYQPVCHTSSLLNRFFIDLGRPAGKSQYAMLLAAQVSGRPVTISLNESCLEASLCFEMSTSRSDVQMGSVATRPT